MLAAQRSTSISRLLAEQMEILVGAEEAYARPRTRRWPCWIKVFTWAGISLPAGMNCMSAKTFVDTNILIYAHDVDAQTKHEIAQGILRELWNRRAGALSTQVLQEFYVNVTRKIASPLSKPSARAVVDNYVVWCVDTTPLEISAAFRIEDECRIGFWDALIIAAARKAGADRILSEDLNAGQVIAGVRVENPFSKPI